MPQLVPVQATMETETKSASGATSTAAKYFRDAQSRTRIEQGQFASINDPQTGKSALLNLPNKIAIPQVPQPPQMNMMQPPQIPPMPGMPQMPKPPEMQQVSDLGEKFINGVKAQGKQYTVQPPQIPQKPELPKPPQMPQAPQMQAPKPPQIPGMQAPQMPQAPQPPKPPQMPQPPQPRPPMKLEVWTSKELQLPIHSTVTDPKSGVTTITQMKDIVPHVKLDPSMFQIPPDFKIQPPPMPAAPKPPSFTPPKL